MNPKLLNKILIGIIAVFLIIFLLQKREKGNAELLIDQLHKENKAQRDTIKLAYNQLYINALEKAESQKIIDSLQKGFINIINDIKFLNKELKNIKGKYKNLETDSLFILSKQRYEKDNGVGSLTNNN